MLFEVSVSFSYLCINQTSFSPNGGKLNRQNSCPSHFSSLLYQRSTASSPVREKKKSWKGSNWPSLADTLHLKPCTGDRELMYYDWRTLPEMVGWFCPKEGRVILNINKNVSQNKQQMSAT